MGLEPNNQAASDYQSEDLSDRERRASIRQYLMGDLSEQEQEQIEKRMLSRDDYFEEVLIAEEELADDFVGGRLPESDSIKFRRRFLSIPELQEDVKFAKALRLHAAVYARQEATHSQAERSPPLLAKITAFLRQPAAGFAMAAVLLLAVCLAIWMAVQNSRLRAQVAQFQAQPAATPTAASQNDLLLQQQIASERERREQLALQLSREQDQRAEAERKLAEARRHLSRPSQDQTPGSSLVGLFSLSPSLIRGPGSELKRISVPADGRVLLRLELGVDNYTTYRATLQTVEGRKPFTLSNLHSLGDGTEKAVALILPAARLAPGNDYQILLSGKLPTGAYEEVGTYNFRVVKE